VHFGLSEIWSKLARIKRRARTRTYVPFSPQAEGEPPPRRMRRPTTGCRSESDRTPTASLSSDTQNTILNRFNALGECFGELLQAGDIRARNDYALVRLVQIGDHSYCAFPMSIGGASRPWTIVNPEDPRLCEFRHSGAKVGDGHYSPAVPQTMRAAC
jgi:hypothetical protein